MTPRVEADPAVPVLVSPVAAYLERLRTRYREDAAGEVATYIPELGVADPNWFGIVLVTVDGTVYEVGDSRQTFTIQSISKPFTFGLVLDELGDETVRRHIGVEPTGEAFNSITLAPGTGIPLNPMVNAGAITATALVVDTFGDDAEARIDDNLSRYAGRTLEVDDKVATSERDTGHRNRAIAHLLRGSGAVTVEPDRAVDTYIEQCSVLVHARDLAVMAATLANGGVNPITGERAASNETVRGVLAVMASCGMYDGAGEWMYRVGLPAKSGVAGGIIAVQPGQFGLAVFSPPLDPHGNSVRGVQVCTAISHELDLHVIESGRRPPSPIRAAYTLAEIGSRRMRTPAERATIVEHGHDVLVLELQGEITFAAAELETRRLIEAGPDLRIALLDLRRVGEIHTSVLSLFVGIAEHLEAVGGELVVTGASDELLLTQVVAGANPDRVRIFQDLDHGLEWAEDRILTAAGVDPAGDTTVIRLEDHDALAGLDAAQVDRIRDLLTPHTFAAGELALAEGDPARELLLVTSGRLTVTIDTAGGHRTRLSTIGAGMVIGEVALFGLDRRIANVWADTDATVAMLTTAAIDRLRAEDPVLLGRLLENVLQIVSSRADRVRAELSRLSD